MSGKLLLRGARIVPLDGRRQEKRGDVLVEGGRLSVIGGLREHAGVGLVVETKSPILPGLVCGFSWPEQVALSRGFVPDPNPRALLSDLHHFSEALSEKRYGELLRAGLRRGVLSGTTAFMMPVRPDRASIAGAIAQEAGVRAVLALTVGHPQLPSALDSLRRGSFGPLVSPALYLGESERAPRRQLEWAAATSDRANVPLVTLLGARGKAGGLTRLQAAGALGKRTVLVLGTGDALRDPALVDQLASSSAKLVLVPSYSLFTGLALPPLDLLLSKGVSLAHGSFSAALRLGLDAFRESRLLSRVLKDATKSPSAVALEIKSAGGAAALGLDSGELSVGRRADFTSLDVLVDDEADHETLCRLLLERSGPGAVRSVWVEGRVVAADGRLTAPWPSAEESNSGPEAHVLLRILRELRRAGGPGVGLIAR